MTLIPAPLRVCLSKGSRSPKMPSLLDVTVLDLAAHADARGSLVAFEPVEHPVGTPAPVQWNNVRSKAHVLRGIHVHQIRWDFLYLIDGEMSLALVDIRHDSDDFGEATVLELCAGTPQRVCIPPGIAHGFLFNTDAVLLQGMSHLWDPADELGCHWTAPGSNIPWQPDSPLLSARDATAGSFSAMVEDFRHIQDAGR